MIARARDLFLMPVEGASGRCFVDVLDTAGRDDPTCDQCGKPVEANGQPAFFWDEARYSLLMHGDCFEDWSLRVMQDLKRMSRGAGDDA